MDRAWHVRGHGNDACGVRMREVSGTDAARAVLKRLPAVGSVHRIGIWTRHRIGDDTDCCKTDEL